MVASFSCRRISWLGLLAVLACSSAAAESPGNGPLPQPASARNPAGHEGARH